MTTKSKIILGLVGAAAAGVIVGLLIAPEKGSDLRKKVKDTAGDWAGSLSDLFSNAKGDLSNLKNKGAKAAGQAFDNVKESYSRFLHEQVERPAHFIYTCHLQYAG